MSQKRTLPNLLITVSLFAFLSIAASAVASAQLKFDGFVRDTNNYCNGVLGRATVSVFQTVDGSPAKDIQPCEGSEDSEVSGNTILSGRDGYFCFLGPDTSYDLEIFAGLHTFRYRWISDNGRTPGVYDIRDFGGVGNGDEVDNSYALKSAAAYIGSHAAPANIGGILNIPNGFFKVMGENAELPVVLPPGMTLQGVSGKINIPSSRIQLQRPGKTVFKIGGCTNKVVMRDVGFYGTLGGDSRVLVAEGYAPQSSQDFVFSSLLIQNFDIGIEVLGLDSDKGWQFDFIKVDNSRIAAEKVGIHIDTINSDWQISNTNISAGPNGTALLIDRVGAMDITNLFGGGGPNNVPINPALLARAFIWFRGDNHGGLPNIGSHSAINIQNSECENTRNSILYDMHNVIYDYFRFPLKLSHNTFGDPISLRANVNLVSLGNIYYSDTVRTVKPPMASDPQDYPGSTKTQIYSFGDQFLYRTSENHNCPPFTVGSQFPMEGDPRKCVRDFILDNTGGLQNRVVFRTSQLSGPDLPRCDPNSPGDCNDWSAYDTLFNKMEGTLQNGGDVLPSSDDQFDMGNDSKRWRTVRGVRVVSGDTVLSDKKTGQELYKIHEDAENIYFSDIRTGKTMMRLDRHGNLFVTGKVISNSKPETVQNPNRRSQRRKPSRR
jgi:hypothetical protein